MNRYRVTFDRIGRHRNVPPLDVEVDGPTHLADLVREYAKPRLCSRDVEVVVDLDAMRGGILCGFNSGGIFVISLLAGDGAR